MNYEIKPATLEDKQILSNLLQFYIYDFSEFMELEFEGSGKYGDYPIDEYWSTDPNYPYLIILNGKIAGFVLVKLKNRDDDVYFSIAEFFIAKKYRRMGLGKLIAIDIFDRHKGQWEVYQIDSNKPAQFFWKKAIEEYTGGKYTERIEAGRKTQAFVSE